MKEKSTQKKIKKLEDQKVRFKDKDGMYDRLQGRINTLKNKK